MNLLRAVDKGTHYADNSPENLLIHTPNTNYVTLCYFNSRFHAKHLTVDKDHVIP